MQRGNFMVQIHKPVAFSWSKCTNPCVRTGVARRGRQDACEGLESQGQNLALTPLYVPCLLDSGLRQSCRHLHRCAPMRPLPQQLFVLHVRP